jgi:hypothetical protein
MRFSCRLLVDARVLDLRSAPPTLPLVCCHIRSVCQVSSVARPEPGGEKRTAVWTSRPEDLGSDGGVAPPVCAHRVVPHRWVVCDRCNPSRSTADAGSDAAARVRGAARAADDGVVDVPQALHGSPKTPPMHAQRVARFDHYRARNCLPPKKLRRDIQEVYLLPPRATSASGSRPCYGPRQARCD